MADVLGFVSMVDTLLDWARDLQASQAARNEDVRKALKSISLAAVETRGYLADLRDGASDRDRSREGGLARLWTEAGHDLAQIDRELAERCLLKADYWSDPTGWDASQRETSAIRLEELHQEARDLLLQPR